MSDARYFTKCKAVDIKDEILLYDKKAKSLKQKKQCMKRIIANITMGNNEIVTLFPFVIQYFTLDDLEMKKMCCYYFSNYFFVNPDILVANKEMFFQELQRGSPISKALVLKTIASFPIPEFQQSLVPLLFRFLNDKDSYVKKTTTFAIGKLYELNPKLVEAEGLIDALNELLLDNNPIVVSSTLAVLDYIVEHHKSMKLVIDEENVKNLFKLLPKSDEFSQSYILNALLSYVPQTNSDAMKLIDTVIPYLQHGNSSVVMNALKIIIYASNYVKAPQDAITSLPKRLGNSLISLLSKPSEIQFLVLRNVILLLLSKPALIKLDVTMFFCQYNDPIYVKDTKLEIIYLLANSSNLKVVLRELEEYATEIDVQMARKSIRAIGNLAIKLDDAATACADVLVNLSSSGIPFIVQETVIVIKNIYRKYPDKFNQETVDTFVGFTDLIEEAEAKCSFLWIIGTYSNSITNALELLKDYTFTIKEETLEVQLTLLTAVVKYYLRNPQKGEQLLLKILKIVTEELNEPDLRDRGYFYWKLLSSQRNFPGSAQDIVLAELPVISSDQDKLDQAILEELELNIGTLASIYLKPVTLVFRLSKHKFLTRSPALQVDYNNSIKSPNPNETVNELPEKVLKINIKSNIGTIKSPKLSSALAGTATNDNNPRSFSIDQVTEEDEHEYEYNPKSIFEKQRFLSSRKKSREMLGALGNDDSSDLSGGNTIAGSIGGSDTSRGPKVGNKVDSLKRRMTFTRRKSVAAPRTGNRNFTG